MNNLYVGISGYARSGKNLFADLLTKELVTNNKVAKQYALAYELKNDCKDFVKKMLDIDVFTEKTEEKNIIRPLLVWYGKVKRTQTQGRYWTEKLQAKMEQTKCDLNIVTDIRYSEYEKDELYWMQHEMEGMLIHITKYNLGRFGKKDFVLPANEDELKNDVVLRKNADILIEWNHVDDPHNNTIINSTVKKVADVVFGEKPVGWVNSSRPVTWKFSIR